MAKPRGLGKGLSALISETSVVAVESRGASAESGVNSLPVTQLAKGKYQPRERFDEASLEELAQSIKKNGLMQPIIVREGGKSGRYEIIAGERRWRAAQIAGLMHVPVIVREIDDQQALELALVENIQRQDLSPLEEAAGYQRLIDEFGYKQDDLAEAVGKSRSHIANLLRLLGLPDEVKEMMDEGKLTMGHARTLLGAPNALELARQIAAHGWTVRQAEDASRNDKGQVKKTQAPRAGSSNWRPPVNKDPDILALEESLSENLGLKVAIHDRGQSGEIVLSYDSLSQLDEILRRLGDGI